MAGSSSKSSASSGMGTAYVRASKQASAVRKQRHRPAAVLPEQGGTTNGRVPEAVAHRIEGVVEGSGVAGVERQWELHRVGVAQVAHRDADEREAPLLD